MSNINPQKSHIELLSRMCMGDVSSPEDVYSYFQKIIDTMPNNVYWLDKNCIALGCNRNVLDLIGLESLDDFVGITYEEMGRLANWTEDQAMSFKKDDMEVITSGEPKLNIEEPPLYDDQDRAIYYLSSRVPLFNNKGDVIGVVGISVDITERKEMEQALFHEKERSEVANKAKQEFLYNMRHDIRTPFAGITGIADLLRQVETDETKLQYIDAINVSAERLLDFLNEILELTQIEDGSVPVVIKLVDIHEMAEFCICMNASAIKEKDLSFTFNYNDNLAREYHTDEFRLKRIITNLLSNAVKFTKKGGIFFDVSLATENSSKKEALIRIKIKDTGIGIPVEKQNIIFEKFERLTASYQGKYKGTGLGLHAVKTLVGDLGGKVHVISKEGEGATFICDIPMIKPKIEKVRILGSKHEKALLGSDARNISGKNFLCF